jgi:hypothetical protein
MEPYWHNEEHGLTIYHGDNANGGRMNIQIGMTDEEITKELTSYADEKYIMEIKYSSASDKRRYGSKPLPRGTAIIDIREAINGRTVGTVFYDINDITDEDFIKCAGNPDSGYTNYADIWIVLIKIIIRLFTLYGDYSRKTGADLYIDGCDDLGTMIKEACDSFFSKTTKECRRFDEIRD